MPQSCRIKWISVIILLSTLITSCGNKKISENKFIYVEKGRLYFPDGKELALWGVNLQPNLSWEYNSLFKLIGVPLDADSLKRATDDALDELQKMDCDLLRCHMVPSDIADSAGNLVETIYLDMLDFMVAEAAKRGMYTYLTFLNPGMGFDIDVDEPKDHTPDFVKHSFAGMIDQRLLIEDEEMVEKSKNYIQQLLNRINPYLQTAYKNEPSIAVWEIINEPGYYSYNQIQKTPFYDVYKAWVSEHGLEDTKESYAEYRHDQVLHYINEMYDAIRETGAVQPIAWNCNWNGMIKGNEDVFEAIGASKVEVVSFCNYPGQSVCKRPYTKNPVDLSRYDFSSFLKDSYVQEDWYGWALRPDFMKKAKTAYEFETFYNQSGYLYPAQADFFRAMGVQMACMWHYSMPRYAPYRNGSHLLSLTSTPHKAASYAIAGQVFRSLPLYHDYDTISPTEEVAENYMYSYKKDLSLYSSQNKYFYSGDVSPDELPLPNQGIQKILGYGSSPLVNYTGTGIYTMHISEKSITLDIEPNIIQLKELWGKDFLVSLVTKLDYTTANRFKLNLEGWNENNCKVVRMVEGNEELIAFTGEGDLSFSAIPGKYKISRN